MESGNVVYNHENHKSRGFGFVIFKNLSSVAKVMSISDHMIMGRKVEVKRAIPKEIEETDHLKAESSFSFSTSLTFNHESSNIKTIESHDFTSMQLDSSISKPKSTITPNQSFPPVLVKIQFSFIIYRIQLLITLFLAFYLLLKNHMKHLIMILYLYLRTYQPLIQQKFNHLIHYYHLFH